MRIKYILFFCFLAHVFNVYCEKSFNIKSITTKDGLTQNTISCILQDRQGFLWFGTLNGLNKYDGNEFVSLQPNYGDAITLSDSRIKNIYEDSDGYIWVKSNINNVNCYNPRTEKFVRFHASCTQYSNIYFSKNGDVWLWGNKTGFLKVSHTTKGLESHFFDMLELGIGAVNFITELSNGEIWIGTNDKLFIYKGNQINLFLEESDFHSVIEMGLFAYVFTNSNKIYKINKQLHKPVSELKNTINSHGCFLHNTSVFSSQKVLITTQQQSYIFDSQSLKITVANSLFKGDSLRNAFVKLDNKNHLWVYNMSGIIWQYDSIQNLFRPFELIPPSIVSNIDMERYSIYHDSKDMIWISTYGNGLFVINHKNNEVNHLKHHKNLQDGLNTNFLLSITEDRSGNIWLGTEYAGIAKIKLEENKYPSFYPGGDASREEDKVIRMVYEDDSENVWLGTKSGNLYIYDKYFGLIAKHHIKGGMPYVLAMDTLGNKWIGTKGNGLLVFKKNEFGKYIIFNDELLNINAFANKIYAICKDTKGRMWLGTFGYGLLLAKTNNGKLEFIDFPEIRKQQNRIRSIFQDRDGVIWLGGNNGLLVFNPDSLIGNQSQFVTYQFDSENNLSLNNNEVKTIFEDSNGRIWIGTSGGGLNQVIKNNDNTICFEHYTSKDGLVNDIVQGIQEDKYQNLWIGTESGISLFSLQTKHFENYSLSSKWEGDLICESAICKSKNKNLFLGSYAGLYRINPDSMRLPVKHEPVVFTELRVNGNRMLPTVKESPLSESISFVNEIHLKYNQNSFNIQFAVLNYEGTNRYTYILDGYEKHWNTSTQHNVATYRNIPSGDYVFRVKGSDNLGVWNKEETTLQIKLEQPYWRSNEAIVLYFLVLVLIAMVTVIVNRKINTLNAAVKFEHQLSEYKIRFFTNISHEFRTPLTIIRSAIENLIGQTDVSDGIKKQIVYLDKSSRRMLKLTNQFLEYRKIQNEQVKLELCETEIVSFFKDIFSTFQELAERKNVTYDFVCSMPDFSMLLDGEKMEKVVYNLLSNAFKFVKENGNIALQINVNQDFDTLSISVSDDGQGVPKKDQELLFTRFKQISVIVPGTGIGLNLCYEIVKLHQGRIQYVDTHGGGATFNVTIPIIENANDNQTHFSQEKSILLDVEVKDDKEISSIPLSNNELDKYKEYKILVIEDDPDVSDYLNDFLKQYFKVIVAINGLDGVNKCAYVNPNLIVCDAMMPKMDGYQVVKQIKSDFKTCHIPIIMLTAYASSQYQLKGIEAGADSYITKPFSSQYLITRMTKLLDQRCTLQQKYAIEPGISSLPKYAINRDNEFMKELNKTIEQNISNSEFSMEDFYVKMSMGRTIFYKKVKGLTGFTPNEYMRIVRMKEAAKLLTTTQLNVSEVAYKVGSGNPFYFSKCFKQQFGISPSEYAKNGGSIG